MELKGAGFKSRMSYSIYRVLSSFGPEVTT